MHQWEKETQMPWQIIVKCRLLAFLLPLYGQSIYDPKDTGVSTNFLAYKYLCSCQNAQGRSFDGTEVALLHRGGTRLLEEEASSLQDGHMKLEQITHSGHLRASKLPCPPHFFCGPALSRKSRQRQNELCEPQQQQPRNEQQRRRRQQQQQRRRRQ